MKLVVFDTETTGLLLHDSAPLESQPRIIEFAGVIVDTDIPGIVETYSQLINPMMPISEKITEITGITNDDLVGKPTFGQVLANIASLFGKADAALAHNYQFDEGMLRNELRRVMVTNFPWPPRGICTVQMYAEEWGRNPRLIELYAAKLGKPLAQTHRALDDVHALVEIVLKEQLWTVFPN